MACDWTAGDMALCIHEMDWHPQGLERAPNECPRIIEALRPRVGTVWRVAAVEKVVEPKWAEGEALFLHLEGQPRPYMFNAQFFVKISRPVDDEAETVCEPRNAEALA